MVVHKRPPYSPMRYEAIHAEWRRPEPAAPGAPSKLSSAGDGASHESSPSRVYGGERADKRISSTTHLLAAQPWRKKLVPRRLPKAAVTEEQQALCCPLTQDALRLPVNTELDHADRHAYGHGDTMEVNAESAGKEVFESSEIHGQEQCGTKEAAGFKNMVEQVRVSLSKLQL